MPTKAKSIAHRYIHFTSLCFVKCKVQTRVYAFHQGVQS